MQVCNEIERENYPPAENNAGDPLVEKVNYPEMFYMSYISLWLLCILIYGKFCKLPWYLRSEGKHPKQAKCLCLFVATSKTIYNYTILKFSFER